MKNSDTHNSQGGTLQTNLNVWNLLDIMTGRYKEFIETDYYGQPIIKIENKRITGPGDNYFHELDCQHRIEFRNCIFDVHFSLGKSNFKGSLLLIDCVFNEGLWWKGCDFGEFFMFSKCRFLKSVNISAFECYRFHIDDCIFFNLLVIAEGTTKKSEDKSYGRNGGDLSNIKAKHVMLKNNDFAWVTIYFHHIGVLEIGSGTYEERILLHKSANPDLYPLELTEKVIDELKIHTKSKDTIGEIYVSKCEIREITLTGELNSGNFIFEDVSTDKLSFNKFTNTSILKFIRLKNLTNQSRVEIIETYLGKAQFFEIDFTKFSKLYIDNSHLVEILTTFTNWPTKIFTKDDNPHKLKENYRQLKVAMRKQEEGFQALVFEQEEMNAYSNTLDNNSGNWQEKFIIWTSRESNYFGRDWITPVVWMIIFNYYFFFFIGASIFWNNSEGFDNYLKNIGRIVHLFNPAHLVTLLDTGINSNNLALVLDFASRITTSYFLFQTIKAFRKYSK
ncbi:hypothetical protein [Adhaeribacter terreus]|uniref:Pentapeptide repeat-containing protein n=1 Tax=Adhaeribacter terreus TaxID=529703 RepID=A0ABW0E9T5_9BACT